jgi:hypothetical protein
MDGNTLSDEVCSATKQISVFQSIANGRSGAEPCTDRLFPLIQFDPHTA